MNIFKVFKENKKLKEDIERQKRIALAVQKENSDLIIRLDECEKNYESVSDTLNNLYNSSAVMIREEKDITTLTSTAIIDRYAIGAGAPMNVFIDRAKEGMFDEVKPFIEYEIVDDPLTNNSIVKCALKVVK